MVAVTINVTAWPLGRRNYRRDLPGSFDELEESRRLPLWRTLLSAPGAEGQLRAIKFLLKLPPGVFRKISPDQAFSLMEATPWLHSDPSPTPRFKSFRHKGETYYLPAGHGLNMAALEYPIADEAFMAWAGSGSDKHLAMLCGTLCRERNEDESACITRGDKRVPLLSKSEATLRAERFKDLPEHIRTGVVLYFAGVKEFVSNSYGKVLFEQPEEGENAPSTTPNLGWWSIYFNLAVDGPFGRHINEVRQANFHEVCLYLVDRIQQQKQEAIRAALARKSFGES